MSKTSGLKAYVYALVVAALSAAPQSVTAQTYPSEPIHVIAAFPPGSGADTIVRFFAEKIRLLAGQPVVVESKPGAGGNVAAEHLVRAKPDGHTIFIHAGNGLASNHYLIKNNPVRAHERIQIAGTIGEMGFMFVVHDNSPIKTFPDLVSNLKAKGAKASFGNSANSGQILGALLNEQAGLQAVQVSYRNAADTINDLSSGVLDFAIIDPTLAVAQRNAGRLRILAVVSKQRIEQLPEIVTTTELGYKMDLQTWFAAMVPAETPKPVVNQINAWFNQIVASDDAKKFITDFGGTPYITTPEQGQERLIKDIAAWKDFVRVAKLEPQ